MKKKNGQKWKNWFTLVVVSALCLVGVIMVFIYFGILAAITLIAVLVSMVFYQNKHWWCKYV